MYYTKCQHNIKNIKDTKLDKSIVYKYKFWQRQSLFGTSTFSEDIGLAASQSCRENRCLSVKNTYTCTEWRNSTRATGNSRFENTKFPPRQRKNSRKFPFAKMLDFALSNTISTHISNIYLKQLQWYGAKPILVCFIIIISLLASK